MATRHNSCRNPAAGVDAAGWSGETTPPTRQSVTGFGRPFAVQYVSGTFMRTTVGAAAPGQAYTLSLYVRPSNGFAAGGSIYIEWRDSSNAVISYSNSSYTLTANTVTRASITATAPAGTATAQAILDGANYSVTVVEATMLLIEQTASLLGYFDGDSPGGAWDGTPGSSSSTLTDAITGTLIGTLPPLTGGLTGAVSIAGVLAGTLPALTGSFIGHSDAVSGTAEIVATSQPLVVLGATSQPITAMAADTAALADIRSTSG